MIWICQLHRILKTCQKRPTMWLSEMTPRVCFCGDQVCFFPMWRCSLSEGLLFGAISANPVVSFGLLVMLFETSSPPRLSVATPLSWTPLRRRIRIKESWNLTKYAIITKVLHNQKPGWKRNVVCLMKVYRKKKVVSLTLSFWFSIQRLRADWVYCHLNLTELDKDRSSTEKPVKQRRIGKTNKRGAHLN